MKKVDKEILMQSYIGDILREAIEGPQTPNNSLLAGHEMREKIAEKEHEQWAYWAAYMLEHSSPENIKRWKLQIETPYSELSETEKNADRKWADKILALFPANETRDVMTKCPNCNFCIETLRGEKAQRDTVIVNLRKKLIELELSTANESGLVRVTEGKHYHDYCGSSEYIRKECPVCSGRVKEGTFREKVSMEEAAEILKRTVEILDTLNVDEGESLVYCTASDGSRIEISKEGE